MVKFVSDLWQVGGFLMVLLYQVSVITVFTVFRLLTDFVCLYNYEFWLSLCKIVRSSVILLLPLFHHQQNCSPRYNWNIIESGVKYHKSSRVFFPMNHQRIMHLKGKCFSLFACILRFLCGDMFVHGRKQTVDIKYCLIISFIVCLTSINLQKKTS